MRRQGYKTLLGSLLSIFDPALTSAPSRLRFQPERKSYPTEIFSDENLPETAIPIPLISACRKESEVLQAKNATLVASSRTQLQEINFLRMRCDALAADCDLAREEISTRDHKIVKLQSLITGVVIAERDSLGRERATLSKDRDLVNTDRRSTVGALKRSVEFLQTQILQQERADYSASNLRESETPEDQGEIGTNPAQSPIPSR
ncbi:hypothetical protein B0H13DRAFT_1892633 [Mycena leptocephala]|nr:hypothetical protein B0H13DRAFT_1892633 [Mycena leptocephala]